MSKYTNKNQDIAGIENLTKFQGFYRNRYLDPFIGGNSFIFMTKPSLFLSTSDSNDPIERIAYSNMLRDQHLSQFLDNEALTESDRILANQLTFNSQHRMKDKTYAINYLPMITNTVRSIDTMDVSMESISSSNTKYGHNMPLPRTIEGSITSGSVSLAFTETSNLDIMKTVGIWIRYMEGISNGSLRANPEMIKNGVVDYMSSIYHFVLEPDGRTIKYWSKLTGVWPTHIPYNVFTWNKGSRDVVDIDVSFNYTVKEDMTVSILEDFNKVSLNLSDNEWNNYYNTNYMIELGSPVRESRILRKDELRTILKDIYGSEENIKYRQPLVYLDIPEGVDEGDFKDAKFRLSFAYEDMGYDFVKETTGEDYIFTKEDYISSLDD